jgi:pyocin large subunit-like protein
MKKISEETNKNITETFLDNGNDGVVQKRSLDVSSILENNKRLYTQNDGYSPDKGLKRVATIPTIILEIWTKEYHKDQNKGNWFDLPKEVQQKILREKLNSSDYRYFRTASGRF